jgi:hypothetical protein
VGLKLRNKNDLLREEDHFCRTQGESMKNSIIKLPLTATLAIIGAMACATPIAQAHHSPASFDMKQTVTVKGVLSKVYWGNPHVYIYLEETTDAGKKIEWEVECFPPLALRRIGWSKETLRIGEVLSISGNPAKNENSKELFPTVIKRGETTLYSMQEVMKKFIEEEPAQSTTAETTKKVATKANGLNGTWSTTGSMQALAKAMTPEPSTLTKEGADALKRFDEKTGPATSCIPSPAPWPMLLPDHKRITTSDSAILIEGEYDNSRRTIHMNVTTHAGAIPSFTGHSIGRWEGDSLVIDTTHFAYHGTGNGASFTGSLPSSTQKHVVERLTPNPDGKRLTYYFELTDPVFLKTAKTGSFQLTLKPDEKFVPEPCTIESARRFIKN